MRQQPIIAGSILSANFARLGDDVNLALDAGVNWIHFDVMDHHYVPNLTVGSLVCKSLRDFGISAPIDVHLMVTPVEPHIEDFVQAGADYITFHPDTTHHVDRVIETIKSAGCKCGIAFNPAMPIEGLEYILDKIDLILLMSVNPGFGGQKFINNVLGKVAQARDMIDSNGKDIRLQVDGGINNKNIKEIFTAGADTFVVGSHIFNSNDYNATIGELKTEMA
ncbi:MAG: ribulose-phosphate 3-epimerase [Francisellaceae bacterium]|jgi:ribulose-phosphate 3-epimerase|nr:ribulose-phosphate 3-epimerase [Francisellaceae bacterium]MBT6206962.1 ribulose-phosphate 3-epimerase [Francisellaceae bacterium]MBT6538222.1 ribulose-phosphate 3-epimerase [Francisellaceae bacterium]